MSIRFGIATLLVITGCSTMPKPSPCANSSIPPKVSKKSHQAQHFDQSEPFAVRFITSNSAYPSSSGDTSLCDNWLLTIPQLDELLGKLEPIPGEDWHHLFEHLPCQIIGQVDQHGTSYCFAVNGGSWAAISSFDTTVYFGDRKGRFRDLFIHTAWNPEQEQ